MKFIKSMINVVRTSRRIKKECLFLFDTLKPISCDLTQHNIDSFNSILYKALDIIDVAEIDDEFKDPFRTSFLGRTLSNLKDLYSDKSGNELYELFGWEYKLYKDMLYGMTV